MRYGYKASAEQFGPRELLDYARLGELEGLSTIGFPITFSRGGIPGGMLQTPWCGSAPRASELSMRS
jgi:hypothetical protein